MGACVVEHIIRYDNIFSDFPFAHLVVSDRSAVFVKHEHGEIGFIDVDTRHLFVRNHKDIVIGRGNLNNAAFAYQRRIFTSVFVGESEFVSVGRISSVLVDVLLFFVRNGKYGKLSVTVQLNINACGVLIVHQNVCSVLDSARGELFVVFNVKVAVRVVDNHANDVLFVVYNKVTALNRRAVVAVEILRHVAESVQLQPAAVFRTIIAVVSLVEAREQIVVGCVKADKFEGKSAVIGSEHPNLRIVHGSELGGFFNRAFVNGFILAVLYCVHRAALAVKSKSLV